MIEQLENIDHNLFLLINGLHTPLLDTVMWYISTIVLWIPLFLFFFYYGYKKGKWQMTLLLVLGIALCILLADRISVEFFKEVFQRYRPSHNLDLKEFVHTVHKPNGNPYLGGQYGFVSSHAANFFSITTFLIAIFRQYSKQWFWLYLWAALIAYSRIYLGVHYPSDVFVGGLLGVTLGMGVYLLAKPFIKKYGII